jgi:hypothetical protein
VAGIEIDLIRDCENAFDSSRINRELDSNSTEESDLHFAKHEDPRTSKVDGITTD